MTPRKKKTAKKEDIDENILENLKSLEKSTEKISSIKKKVSKKKTTKKKTTKKKTTKKKTTKKKTTKKKTTKKKTTKKKTTKKKATKKKTTKKKTTKKKTTKKKATKKKTTKGKKLKQKISEKKSVETEKKEIISKKEIDLIVQEIKLSTPKNETTVESIEKIQIIKEKIEKKETEKKEIILENEIDLKVQEINQSTLKDEISVEPTKPIEKKGKKKKVIKKKKAKRKSLKEKISEKLTNKKKIAQEKETEKKPIQKIEKIKESSEKLSIEIEKNEIISKKEIDFKIQEINRSTLKNEISVKPIKPEENLQIIEEKIKIKETEKKEIPVKSVTSKPIKQTFNALDIAKSAIEKKKRDDYDSKIDILEYTSRDLDQAKIIRRSKSVGTSNYDLDTSMSPCIACKHMFGICPKEIDIMEMENVTECDFYEPPEQNVAESSSTVQEKQTTQVISPIINVSSSKTKEDLDSNKQKILDSILKNWDNERGKLRVICTFCEVEMIYRTTQKKEAYVCPNFPECKVEANPWYVNVALNNPNGIATNKLRADLIIIYKFDKRKNIISISEIFSESKIFL